MPVRFGADPGRSLLVPHGETLPTSRRRDGGERRNPRSRATDVIHLAETDPARVEVGARIPSMRTRERASIWGGMAQEGGDGPTGGIPGRPSALLNHALIRRGG